MSAAPSAATAPVDFLLTTYRGETGEHLARALDSLYAQGRPAASIVLVIDGPVGADQEDVIATAATSPHVTALRVVRLPARTGLANALNAGLRICDHEFVARMDSDDISAPDRLELQLAVFATRPELDIVFSWQAEFSESPAKLTAIKTAPAAHADIVRRLKWRNVLSHPTMLARRRALTSVGGYEDLYLLEDYDLYMRMVSAGVRLGMVERPLVSVRTTAAQRARRGGWRHVRSELEFRRRCLRRGNLSPTEFVATTILYTLFRLLPPGLRGFTYRLVRADAHPSVSH